MGLGEEQSGQPVILPAPPLTISRSGKSLGFNSLLASEHLQYWRPFFSEDNWTNLSNCIFNEIVLIRRRRATGRHKLSVNWASVIQWSDIRICLQSTWCFAMDKSHILLKLLGICCYRFPLAAYWGTPWLWILTLTLSSVTLTISSSLVSFRDCPSVASASWLLLLEEILASKASLAVIPPTPTVPCPPLDV